MFIYPFGAEPPGTSPIVSMLHDGGYRILCDIDVGPGLRHVDGVAVMARRHIDGLALRQLHRQLLPLFDTNTVIDRTARHL